MTTTHAGRTPLGRVREAIPTDLLLVVAYAFLVDALVIASVGVGPVRFLLGMVFLCFVPGYAVVAALFPGRPRRSSRERTLGATLRGPHEGLLLSERVAISFGTSVALVPVVAVVLGALAVPLTREAILGSLTVVVIGFAAIGALRRMRLRPADRFHPFGREPTRGDGGQRAERTASRGSTALAVGLVLAVGLAGGAFVYGIAAEPPSTQYTSATLLTESADGEYVASGYPANGSVGEPVSLTLRVDNRQTTPANVSAVVALERPDAGGDGVVERDRLTTLQDEVSPNGQWNASHQVAPTFAGEDLRLAYYVYEGEVPPSIGPDTADHELFVRIDVEPESTES